VKRNAHDEGDGIPFFEKGRELLPAVLAFDGVQDDERTGRLRKRVAHGHADARETVVERQDRTFHGSFFHKH
jgi:hypothetical protein